MAEFGPTGRSWNRNWSGVYVRLAMFAFYLISWTIAIRSTDKMPEIVTRLFETLNLSPDVSYYLCVDLICTFMIFIFSFITNNSSCYDPYWSIVPVLIVISKYAETETVTSFRSFGLIFAISFWGLRLTFNWTRSFDTFTHEDWRYRDLRNKTLSNFPNFIAHPIYWIFLSLLGYHIYPTIAVFLGLAPAITAMNSNSPMSMFDIVGVFIGICGTIIEGIADEQLKVFRENCKFDQKKLLQTGLYGYVRHPNYVGEMMNWIGIAIVGFGVTKDFLTLSGAVGHIILFALYSGPAMDERMMKSRGILYKQYCEKTPAFIPKLF